MANSSFYKLSREVSSIKRAILILGITMIKDIALSIAILDMFKSASKGLISSVWEHSVATSIGSKLLSINFTEDIDSDVCFTAGLLHDIGKMLMAKQEKYSDVIKVLNSEGEKKALTAESALYGFTHTELGAVLATVWDFSPEMHYIIFNHHIISDILKVDKEALSVPDQYVWNTAIVATADYAAHLVGGNKAFSYDKVPEKLITFLGYSSTDHFKESFMDNFEETFDREKGLFS